MKVNVVGQWKELVHNPGKSCLEIVDVGKIVCAIDLLGNEEGLSNDNIDELKNCCFCIKLNGGIF